MTASVREQFAEQIREQLAEKIGAEELSPRGGNPALDDLRRQLQKLAPEVVAGDAKATTEAARIEDEIAAEERRVRLADLAAVEQAARERAAADAEAEKVRQEASVAKLAAEAERATEVAKADALSRKLAASLARVRELDAEVSIQGSVAEGKPGYSFPRAVAALENAISWDLQSLGIRDLAFVSGPRPEIPEAYRVKPKAKKPAPATTSES